MRFFRASAFGAARGSCGSARARPSRACRSVSVDAESTVAVSHRIERCVVLLVLVFANVRGGNVASI